MFSKFTSLFTVAAILGSALAAPAPTVSSSPVEVEKTEKRLDVSPKCAHFEEWPGTWHYALLIPDGHTYDKSCGGGLLDNVRGQGLVATSWGCDYGWGEYPDSAAVANFYTTVWTETQVQNAYKAAYGKDVDCVQVDGPPVMIVG